MRKLLILAAIGIAGYVALERPDAANPRSAGPERPYTGPGPDPRIELTGDAVSRADVEHAVAVFWKTCDPLRRNREDVSVMRVTTRREAPDFMRDKGWRALVEIAIPLPETLTSLPVRIDGAGPVGGHTLHYTLGGGRRPGIYGWKRVSQALCDLTVSQTGATTFRDVSALGFLP